MMFKLNIQLFASKKGVGSTKNGRDSESKRLGAKNPTDSSQLPVRLFTVNGERKFIRVSIR